MAHPPPDRDRLREVLEAGLRALAQPAEPGRVDRWERLALLLDRWSQRINLTGHRGALAIAQRLLLEAVALHRVLPPASSVADLGSGAGVPGLPLALCRPESRVLLIEARERRHHFQRAAVRELGLENVRALHGRAEALAVEPCEGVVSQAFAPAASALRQMLPWAAPGGWVAIASQPEAGAPAALPELAPGRLIPYAAPAGPPRAAWIFRRRAP